MWGNFTGLLKQLRKEHRQWQKGECGMASVKSYLYAQLARVGCWCDIRYYSCSFQPLPAWLQHEIPCKHLSLQRKYLKISFSE